MAANIDDATSRPGLICQWVALDTLKSLSSSYRRQLNVIFVTLESLSTKVSILVWTVCMCVCVCVCVCVCDLAQRLHFILNLLAEL